MTPAAVRRLGTIAFMVLVPSSCVGLQDFGDRRGTEEAGDASAVVGDGGAWLPVDANADSDGSAEAGPPPDVVRIPGGPVTVVWYNGATSSTRLTHDFDVDRHEVTVGTFRAWVNAGMPAPCPGATCSLEPGGPYENSMRWYPADDPLVKSPAYKEFSCDDQDFVGYNVAARTYPRGDDRLPVNCVTFAQAAAVCHFRGMRLLTEVEWYWIASGRGQQRTFPWGDADPTDCTQTIFNPDEAGPHAGPQFCGFPQPVEMAPGDVSRDGVRDLGGSLGEWIWDTWTTRRSAVLPDDFAGDPRITNNFGMRGGYYGSSSSSMQVTQEYRVGSGTASAHRGFRCARTTL